MDDQKKLQEKSKFVINDLVLCYEPDPAKARVLYDAKVLDIDVTKDDKGRKVCEYYIHFQGWNKSWDRWILEEQILKDNESSRSLQTKLHKEAIKPKNKRKKKLTKSENLEEKDDKSVISTGSVNSAAEIEEDTQVIQLPVVSLDIPKVLASRLEDDCYNIKRKKKLIHLPRQPSVNAIFNAYFEHCAKINNNIIQVQTSHSLQIVKEKPPRNILPTKEGTFSPPITPSTPRLISPQSIVCTDSKTTSPSNSRTSSLSEDLSLSSYASWKQRHVPTEKRRKRTRNAISSEDPVDPSPSMGTRSRRNTISGCEEKLSPLVTCENVASQLTEPEISPSTIKSCRETRLSSRKSHDVNIKQEPVDDSMLTTDNRDDPQVIPRLRRSNRAVKMINVTLPTDDEVDYLPVGSTAKSLQENTKHSTLTPLSINTDDQSKQETPLDDKSFMLYPQRIDGDTPADIYGAEHLLRLFVKLPTLLASSNIDDERLNLILSCISNFLDYLTTRADLFSNSVYSESVI